jgi:predicted lipoprotein with Yx(FWY)xxD motif
MGTAGAFTENWKRICAAVMVALVLALAISSCGDSESTAGTSGGESTETTESRAEEEKAAKEKIEKEREGPQSSKVSTGTPGAVGSVVVDQVGFTLYHFSKDQKDSGKSACYGKCAKVWPPYLTAAPPEVMVNAQQDQVGTIKRKDGTEQITYGGYPMYTFASDPSAATGGVGKNSFGGVWWPVNRQGEVVDAQGQVIPSE